MLQGLIYFFKVSPALNLGKKISPTTTSGLEPQNLFKFCPEYWLENGLIKDYPNSSKLFEPRFVEAYTQENK